MVSVAQLREWLTLREEAVKAAGLAEASAATLHANETTLESARQTLASATAQPATGKSFRKLLDDAEAVLKTALDSASVSPS